MSASGTDAVLDTSGHCYKLVAVDASRWRTKNPLVTRSDSPLNEIHSLGRIPEGMYVQVTFVLQTNGFDVTHKYLHLLFLGRVQTSEL